MLYHKKKEFEFSDIGKGLKGRSPWSLSVDRINNDEGYVKGNVQLTCLIYNLCKSSWSEKIVNEFCLLIIRDYE